MERDKRNSHSGHCTCLPSKNDHGFESHISLHVKNFANVAQWLLRFVANENFADSNSAIRSNSTLGKYAGEISELILAHLTDDLLSKEYQKLKQTQRINGDTTQS